MSVIYLNTIQGSDIFVGVMWDPSQTKMDKVERVGRYGEHIMSQIAVGVTWFSELSYSG